MNETTNRLVRILCFCVYYATFTEAENLFTCLPLKSSRENYVSSLITMKVTCVCKSLDNSTDFTQTSARCQWLIDSKSDTHRIELQEGVGSEQCGKTGSVVIRDGIDMRSPSVPWCDVFPRSFKSSGRYLHAEYIFNVSAKDPTLIHNLYFDINTFEGEPHISGTIYKDDQIPSTAGLSSDALGALVSIPIFLLAAAIGGVIVCLIRRKPEEQPDKSETGIEIGIQTSFRQSSNKEVITENIAHEASIEEKTPLGNKLYTGMQLGTSVLELKVPKVSEYRRTNNYVTFPIINGLLNENTRHISESGNPIKLPQSTTNGSTVSTIAIDELEGTLC